MAESSSSFATRERQGSSSSACDMGCAASFRSRRRSAIRSKRRPVSMSVAALSSDEVITSQPAPSDTCLVAPSSPASRKLFSSTVSRSMKWRM